MDIKPDDETTLHYENDDDGWKKVGELFPHAKAFADLFPELNRESDRGVALIVCSFLDNVMKDVVTSFMMDCKETKNLVSGRSAPLSSFSSRIDVAFVLGLISEIEYQECNRLRSIRNDFAHLVHVKFSDQKISDKCKNLVLGDNQTGAEVPARLRYVLSSSLLILHLMNRPAYVSLQRREYGNWAH